MFIDRIASQFVSIIRQSMDRAASLINRISIRKSSTTLNLSTVAIATIVGKVANLFNLGYLARILGPEGYGLVSLGVALAAYAGILLSPGLTMWGNRAVARNKSDAGKLLVIVNITQIILSVIGFACLFAYAWSQPLIAQDKTVIILSGLVLFNTAISIDWVFNGLELMRIPASLNAISPLLTTVALLLFVQSPDSIVFYPLLTFLITLSIIVTGYVILLKKVKVRLSRASVAEFRDALIQSFPLGITVALITVLHYANNLIVQQYLGTKSLGIFSSSFRLIEQTTTIPAIILTVFLPRLSRLVVESFQTARVEATRIAQIHMIIGFGIAAFFFSEATSIVNVMYGPNYTESALLLRIMSVSIVFNFAICGYTNCLIPFGKDRVMLVVVLVSAIVSVGGGLLLVPRIGVIGAALIVAIIDLAGWLISLPTYRRTIGSINLSEWLKPFIGGVIVIVVGFLLQGFDFPFVLRIIICAVCYMLWCSPQMLKIYRAQLGIVTNVRDTATETAQ